jgi:hypothetical protein
MDVFFTSWEFYCSGSRNAEIAIQYLKLADRWYGTGSEKVSDRRSRGQEVD